MPCFLILPPCTCLFTPLSWHFLYSHTLPFLAYIQCIRISNFRIFFTFLTFHYINLTFSSLLKLLFILLTFSLLMFIFHFPPFYKWPFLSPTHFYLTPFLYLLLFSFLSWTLTHRQISSCLHTDENIIICTTKQRDLPYPLNSKTSSQPPVSPDGRGRGKLNNRKQWSRHSYPTQTHQHGLSQCLLLSPLLDDHCWPVTSRGGKSDFPLQTLQTGGTVSLPPPPPYHPDVCVWVCVCVCVCVCVGIPNNSMAAEWALVLLEVKVCHLTGLS